MILGKRDFNQKKVPLRSKLGNCLATIWVKLRTGYTVKDTQTGLRAIPISWIPELIKIKGERYEYEMRVLLQCIKQQKKIESIPIEAIYHKNQKTYFKPIQDTIKIAISMFRQ